MQHRIDEEVRLLKGRYPELEYRPEGNWVRIFKYPLPEGWSRLFTEVAFQIVPPPAAPYGIYVNGGLLFRNQRPNNYNEPVANVPFTGGWGLFSWTPADGEWRPGTSATNGSNYVNWAIGFADRFREGI